MCLREDRKTERIRERRRDAQEERQTLSDRRAAERRGSIREYVKEGGEMRRYFCGGGRGGTRPRKKAQSGGFSTPAIGVRSSKGQSKVENSSPYEAKTGGGKKAEGSRQGTTFTMGERQAQDRGEQGGSGQRRGDLVLPKRNALGNEKTAP